ncbi:hypothetical protein BJ875DRAFT_455776 [Amylocarpus encephaloides]|uniref:Uncharacterized protein n=1 Tax=Amylocarpus encephaloides TaxID=45428 RepID=A0A9P7YND3_9HELO|nr:hypothetical protein BJ875DRAFT_455776 [Amylocarpus encephaloides]
MVSSPVKMVWGSQDIQFADVSMDNNPNQPILIASPPTEEDRPKDRKAPWASRLMFRRKVNPSYVSIEMGNTKSATSTSSIDGKAPSYTSTDLKKTDRDYEDSMRQIPSKPFAKRTRFLGINFGKWRVFVRHFTIFALVAILISIPVWLVSVGIDSIQGSTSVTFGYDCYGVVGGGWSFLGINLVVATDFNYGTAKGLDLIWNWLVGRGLQGILAIFAYRVSTDALLRAAELTPLSFELYASIALYTNKFEVLWELLLGFGRFGNWRVKAILLWLFFSAVYLLAFPSLLDACSGYDAAQKASFSWPNGKLQNVDDAKTMLDKCIYATSYSSHRKETLDCTSDILSTRAICPKYNITEQMVYTNFSYTFPKLGVLNRTSTYSNSYISEPQRPRQPSWLCLDDTNEYSYHSRMWNLYYWNDTIVNQTWWDHFHQDPYKSQPDYWDEWNFWPSNKTAGNFVCDTKNNLYQWGFSYEWIFVTVIANSVWVFGMWVMWFECDVNSELCKKGRRLGRWRAILDLSEAMTEELGDNMAAYSDHELGKSLQKRLPIKYYVSHNLETEPAHIGLSSRPSDRIRLRWGQVYGKTE